MRENGIKNKKEDVELFGSSLQSAIQSRCEGILKVKSATLSEKTKNYIEAFSASIEKPFKDNNLNIDFDAGWAFASALSTLGVIGGFGAFLASTISGAILFAGIGFGIGSSILAGMATASIFGPVGIAAGLLIAGGLGLAKLFGGGWEKSVAKKIVAAMEENDVADKYREGIKKYWTQTERAFNQAAEKLDTEWNAYVENLRAMVDSYDINEIQTKIATLKYLSDFFDNIPL